MKIKFIILLFGIFTCNFAQHTDHSSTIIFGDNEVEKYETPKVVHLGLVNPGFSEWPVTEHFLDVVSYIPMNEFTVHQTMLPTSFVWGYLAGVTR